MQLYLSVHLTCRIIDPQKKKVPKKPQTCLTLCSFCVIDTAFLTNILKAGGNYKSSPAAKPSDFKLYSTLITVSPLFGKQFKIIIATYNSKKIKASSQ
jgi:hypothetical protein